MAAPQKDYAKISFYLFFSIFKLFSQKRHVLQKVLLIFFKQF